MLNPTSEFSGTEIQGMMMAAWKQGTEIQLPNNHIAHCLNGIHWEIQTPDGYVKTTINPTTYQTCIDLRKQLVDIITNKYHDTAVYSSAPPDSEC